MNPIEHHTAIPLRMQAFKSDPSSTSMTHLSALFHHHHHSRNLGSNFYYLYNKGVLLKVLARSLSGGGKETSPAIRAVNLYDSPSSQ